MEQGVIKFHCPTCGQKIGLPSHYAGSKVRCAKCRNPLTVPGAQSPPTPRPVAGGTSDDPFATEPQAAQQPPDQFDPWADLPALQPITSADAESEVRLEPLSTPSSQPTDNIDSGYVRSNSAVSAVAPRDGSGGLKIDSTPAALAASIAFVVIGGMVWGLVAKYLNMELGLLAWAIGLLAGLGIYMFTASRGTALGIAAALIAFFGILCGKYFVAKWYYMPELMSEMRTAMDDEFGDPNMYEISDEEVSAIASSGTEMFDYVILQLIDDGELDPNDARYGTAMAMQIMFSKMAQGGFSELETLEEEFDEERRREVEKKVYKCLAEWDQARKEQVVRNQHPKMVEQYAQSGAELMDSPIGSAVGFVVAYICAFSLFDLLWFPIAMVTAYKFGTGESG
jgi:hypothetical protein